MYVNCGAYVDNERPRTKKALREALRDTPERVKFDATSMFHPPHLPAVMPSGEVPAHVRLTVAGPDPYTSRKWFAAVTRGVDGKFKVI